MKSFLKMSALMTVIGASLMVASHPATATQKTDLEYIEADVNVNYSENPQDENEEVLEPVYIEGDAVDVEVFGKPEPEFDSRVFDPALQPERPVGGVEIIQLSVPSE